MFSYKNLIILLNFLRDLIKQAINKNYINKNSSYFLMRIFYRITNGFLTNLISYIISGYKYKNSNKFKKGFMQLKSFESNEVDTLKSQISQMRVFDKRKIDYRNNKSWVDETENYAKSFKELSNEDVVRLDVLKSELLSNRTVANFILDERWVKIVKKILGVEPRLIDVNCWYTLPHKNEFDIKKYDAQIWHKDVDKLRDIKIFFYLSDVDDLNYGPFEIIIDTHRSNYSKIKYENNNNFRISNDIIECNTEYKKFSFIGKRGTNFVVDTRCFHRGGIVEKGYRHIIELYFSNSIFGKHEYYNNFSRPKLNKFWDSYDIWVNAIKKNPKTYFSLFLGKD